MPQKTDIEWTDQSWNPIAVRDKQTGKRGWHCEHASDECDICYSETRNKWIGTGLPFTREARDQVDIYLDEKQLTKPMPKTPSRVFVCDMTDLFAPFVKDEWVDRILEVIARHPLHTCQVLTKRPPRMRACFARRGGNVLGNLWLGTSIGRRRYLKRLAILRSIPATIRFLSLEPLLEDLGEFDLSGIDWVIAGAESDAWRRARPMHMDWVRGIRDQCIAASVPFFFKQDAVRGRKISLPELDGRQWREFPDQPTSFPDAPRLPRMPSAQPGAVPGGRRVVPRRGIS